MELRTFFVHSLSFHCNSLGRYRKTEEIKESDRLEFDLNSRIVYHSILDYENADSFSLLNSCVVLAKIFLQSEKVIC